MAHDSAIPTYAPGTVLTLVIDKANESLPAELQVTIVRLITATMSPVLEVTYTDDTGTEPKKAVLKLFDRRLGSSLRKVWADVPGSDRLQRQYVPANPETESAYRSYARSGKASKMGDQIDADMEKVVKLGWPEEYYEPTEEEGLLSYEAAVQHTCLHFFKCETAAYDKLAHLQGDCIPRMLAHVHLPSGQSSEAEENVEDKTNENVNDNSEDKIEETVEDKEKAKFENKVIDKLEIKAENKAYDIVNKSSPIIVTKRSISSSSSSSSSSSTAPTTSSSRSCSSSSVEDKMEDISEENDTDTVSGRLENNIKDTVDNKLDNKVENQVDDEVDDTVEVKDEDNPFLRVNGVLLEYVSGTQLMEFEDCYPPLPHKQWSSVLQDVVNAAEKINRAGVLMLDASSRNVLLNTDTWQSVFVDFAQSTVGDFTQSSVGDSDDEEEDFGTFVSGFGNPMGIVCYLVKPSKGKGFNVHLKYPDYSDLMAEYHSG